MTPPCHKTCVLVQWPLTYFLGIYYSMAIVIEWDSPGPITIPLLKQSHKGLSLALPTPCPFCFVLLLSLNKHV